VVIGGLSIGMELLRSVRCDLEGWCEDYVSVGTGIYRSNLYISGV
jgi:hypothetical protein